MQLFDGTLRFGVHSGQQYTDLPGYRRLWQLTEEAGLDWASVFDHFLPIQADPTGPCFEGLTLLAAMAAVTTRIRCGAVVMGVTYRHPAVLANAAVTIDHVSGGRLELGIGAAWNQLEHAQYGIDFPSIGDRMDMLEETAQILRSLWSKECTTLVGRHYRLVDARCEPKPLQEPSVPLWIGGAGERRTLRAVARHADGWNTFLVGVDEYRRKLDVLAGHCADAGRSPSDIRKALVFTAVLGEDAADAEDGLRRRAAGLRMDPDRLRASAFVDTPERLAERLAPYAALGVGDFLMMARPPVDERSVRLLAAAVAPELRRLQDR
jgi:F420-dependent oxidoreductase-like protein